MSVTYRLDNLEAIASPAASRLGTRLTGFAGWWERTVNSRQARVIQLGIAVAVVFTLAAGMAWETCSALTERRPTVFCVDLDEPGPREMEALTRF